MTTEVSLETSSLHSMEPEQGKLQAESFDLYINVSENSTGGRPESNDEWCHYSDIVKTVEFNCVYRHRNPKNFWGDHSFQVTEEVYKAPRIFLVIVRYFDGGTFGRTVGHWQIMGAFTTETEAGAMATSIEKGTFEADYPHLARAYMPWEGYFAGMEGTEVHSFPVLDHAPSSGLSKVVYH